MIMIETVTPQKVLELAQTLSVDDFNWLLEQLQCLAADAPLPQSTSLAEAVMLFMADRCSLGRAAELAGVTRWEIIEVLEERGIPVHQDAEMTLEEMEMQFEQLEAMGLV